MPLLGETWIFGSHPLVSLRRTSSRVSLVLLCLTAQSQLTSWFPVGITTRRVHAAQLDKTCHEQNKANTHEGYSPPVFLDPLKVAEDSFLAKELVLQTRQWSIGIHGTALKKHVAVTVKVVAWRTRKLLEILFLQLLLVVKVFCWLAFAIFSILAAQVAEVILLFTLTLQQAKFKADGTTAFP